ncbi:hypothetical protein EFW17_19425 [Halostreptopolyspora alba]|uniref:Lipoprotein n=1 Tax=Halostreptopolyspora alba TaxID=2487137 RepID=A0A3N0E3S8_9ACTN|nr:hypothetical protein EFW17_19425 [Nocardiopsaceae bacterium YIM 96095]
MLAGCGGDDSEDDGPQSPLDEERAEERAEEHITETTSVLPDSLELESFGGSANAACENPDLVTVSTRYWLDGLESEDNEKHVEALHEYWTGHGYTVVEDSRPDDRFVHVRHEEDGFSMSVTEDVDGHLSLGASSPCIDPQGAEE